MNQTLIENHDSVASAVNRSDSGPVPKPPRRKSRVALKPSMSLADAACTVLTLHFNEMKAQEVGVIAGDVKALHDMRVATRRLRAALRDFGKAFDKRALEPIIDDVRWLSDLLGNVRDLDVFIEWLREYAKSIPVRQRQYVHRVLQDRERAREQERAVLLDGLQSKRYQEFQSTFSVLVLDQLGLGDRKRKSLTELASSRIWRQLKRAREIGKKADTKHLPRLHKLRIQCKRLRYTSEFFQSLFTDFPKQLLKKPKEIQDLLGVVHDTQVHSDFLKDIRDQRADDPPMSQALRQMIRARLGEQHAQYKRFTREYRKFGKKKFRRKMMKRLESE